MRPFRSMVLVLLSLVVVGGGPVHAHGIWGHIHVTGWAIESLTDSELQEFFSDPDVMNAALFGAAFTDSGYWPQGGEYADASRTYSEHTHWEPFIQDFVTWIKANDPPPWTSLESKKRVAFLMGCAAHGLQDEIFDSLFLPHVGHHDGKGQDEADPGSDGFMAHADLIRFSPTPYIPMDTVLELYSELDEPVTAEVVQYSVDLMTLLYVNAEVGPEVALTFYDQCADQLPWAFAHFMDPRIPGSLQAEVMPTAGYIKAVWERLHDRFVPNDVRVGAYPNEGEEILGRDPKTPDPWVTFIYGMGAAVSAGPVVLEDQEGMTIPLTLEGTRWGAEYARLHRFLPSDWLEEARRYTMEVPAGIQLIDGTFTTQALTFSFVTEGAPDVDPVTPPVTPPVIADEGGCQSGHPWEPLSWPLVALLALVALGYRRRLG